MRLLKTILTALIMLPMICACNAQSSEKKVQGQDNQVSNIEVYYFHFTRRCATCNAVEEKTVEFLKELYPEKMEGKEIVFQSLNLDEADAKEVAEKLGVSGQALIFLKEGQKVDLTSEGFMNTRNNPEKFKEKVKETVENLI